MGIFLDRKGFGYDTEFNPHVTPPDDAVEITKERLFEIQTGRNHGKILAWDGDTPILKDPPPPSKEEFLRYLRVRRDHLLVATDKITRRHAEERDLGIKTSVSDEDYKKLLTWRQKLRDLPATAKIKEVADVEKAIPACPVKL